MKMPTRIFSGMCQSIVADQADGTIGRRIVRSCQTSLLDPAKRPEIGCSSEGLWALKLARCVSPAVEFKFLLSEILLSLLKYIFH